MSTDEDITAALQRVRRTLATVASQLQDGHEALARGLSQIEATMRPALEAGHGQTANPHEIAPDSEPIRTNGHPVSLRDTSETDANGNAQ